MRLGMEEELAGLKRVLRSLVVSSPTQVDCRALLRDYRQMVGAPLPHQRFGYRDPLAFLKQRCDDCFLFQGPASNPVLTLIVPDELRHIDNFVQKQKISSTHKSKGKRRSVPESTVRSPEQDLILKTFAGRRSSSKEPRGKPVAAPTPTPTTRGSTTKPVPLLSIAITTKPTPLLSVPATNKKLTIVSSTKKDNTICSIKVSEAGLVNGVETANSSPKLEQCSSESDRHSSTGNLSSSFNNSVMKESISSHSRTSVSDKSYSDKASRGEDADSGRQSASSSSGARRQRFEELQLELLDLVVAAPEPVLCTDLVRLYRERYGREVNFARFGLTSILGLACSLGECVCVWRDAGGEWRVRDARALTPPPPHPRQRPRARAATTTHTPRRPPSASFDVDDALPGIDFDPDVFPADCLHFMESVPAAALDDVAPGAMLEVILGEVYSPSHFWVIRLGDNYNLAMEDLMDQMTKYYGSGEGRERCLALGAVRVGHYCSSVYEGDWHRSLIVKILDSDTVKVRHVDYGTVDTVRVCALRPLRREWGALPAQAVRARLAGARPAAGGRRWPRAAAAHFLRLVHDRRLVANVVAVDHQESVLEVFLIDTATEDDVQIGAEMIRAGHADPRPDCALGTAECYLFPRFEALELGDTPNYAEIHQYLRDGIELEFVEDYRRHVPASVAAPLPRRPSPPPSPQAPPQPARTPAQTNPQHSPRTPPQPPHTPQAPRGPVPNPAALNRVPLRLETQTLRLPRPAIAPVPTPASDLSHAYSQPYLPSGFINYPPFYTSLSMVPNEPGIHTFYQPVGPYPPVTLVAAPQPQYAAPYPAPYGLPQQSACCAGAGRHRASPPPPYCARPDGGPDLRTPAPPDTFICPADSPPKWLPSDPLASGLNPEAAEFRLATKETQTDSLCEPNSAEGFLISVSEEGGVACDGGGGGGGGELQPAVRVFLRTAARCEELRPLRPPPGFERQ